MDSYSLLQRKMRWIYKEMAENSSLAISSIVFLLVEVFKEQGTLKGDRQVSEQQVAEVIWTSDEKDSQKESWKDFSNNQTEQVLCFPVLLPAGLELQWWE